VVYLLILAKVHDGDARPVVHRVPTDHVPFFQEVERRLSIKPWVVGKDQGAKARWPIFQPSFSIGSGPQADEE
jgi:hypothetical protein